MKHMDICLHFVRELVKSSLIQLRYIRTTENTADFLTKPTGRCTIRKSLLAMGITVLPSNSAPRLAAQSNPGCRIISADLKNSSKSCKRNTVADAIPLYQPARKMHISRAGCMFGYPMESNHTVTTFLEVSDLQDSRIKSAKLSAQPIKSLKISNLDISDMVK
jgi:hypothetical protein